MKSISLLRVGIFSLIVIMIFFVFLSTKKYCVDCNVILISIDTLRADRLGVYGYNKKTSPNIDKLAKESSVFTNFHATAPWTLPSHASMFASDYPTQLKAETSFDYLSNNTLTIAELLQRNGYLTYGFDSHTYVSPHWNFTQGFAGYSIERAGNKGVDANKVFPHAQDWIKKNKDKKFFLFLHTFEVHDPYCPPEPYVNKFADELSSDLNCVTKEIIFKNINGEKKLSDIELQRFNSLYDGEIAFTDYQIGKLLNLIKELRLDEKTIVIITSDHGEEFGDHGTWGKHAHTLYEELLKVPLIIKIPGFMPSINAHQLSMIDIAPTILDLLGLQKPNQYKGISVRDIKDNRPIYFELSDPGFHFIASVSAYYNILLDINPTERKSNNVAKMKIGVLIDGWKLIKSFNPMTFELYNINRDKNESSNLFFKERDKAKELEKLLNSHFGKDIGENNNSSGTSDTDYLKKAGY